MLEMLKKAAGTMLNVVGLVGLALAAVGLLAAAPFILLVWGWLFLVLAVVVGPGLLWDKLKEADDA